MKEKNRILNDDIKARTVQVVTDDWENLGDMSLFDAKSKAQELNLDLMQMGKKWDIVIVKMLDYGKFLYKQKKQEQKNKQQGKLPDLKTIRITFKISDHDLDVKKKQAEKFAKWWHPLKVALMLRGRENHYATIAWEKMETFVKKLEEVYKVDWRIKKVGNNFSAMLKPIK